MGRLIPLLKAKAPVILEHWREVLLAVYPPETVLFMKRERDEFANPVFHQLTRGLREIWACLMEEQEREVALAALDEVIRVLALHDTPPSQALAFLFSLKQVIREQLAEELKDMTLAPELVDLESRIDGLALLGFDGYMARREKLTAIRVEEIKARVSGLLRRAGIDISNL